MGMQGPTKSSLSFRDWREVNGIRLPYKFVIEQGGQKFAEATVSEWKLNGGLTAAGVEQETMKMSLVLVCASRLGAASFGAETKQERGKRVVDEAVAALGGDKFLNMKDRVESGTRVFLLSRPAHRPSVAKIYTRYLETPAQNGIAVRERQRVRQRRRLLRPVHGRRRICRDVSRRAADADGTVYPLG